MVPEPRRKAAGSSPAKPRSSQTRRTEPWAARSGARARRASRSCTLLAETTRTPRGAPAEPNQEAGAVGGEIRGEGAQGIAILHAVGRDYPHAQRIALGVDHRH